jgi:hypothetical protein
MPPARARLPTGAVAARKLASSPAVIAGLDPRLSDSRFALAWSWITCDAALPQIVIARLDRAIRPTAGVLPASWMRRSSRRMTTRGLAPAVISQPTSLTRTALGSTVRSRRRPAPGPTSWMRRSSRRMTMKREAPAADRSAASAQPDSPGLDRAFQATNRAARPPGRQESASSAGSWLSLPGLTGQSRRRAGRCARPGEAWMPRPSRVKPGQDDSASRNAPSDGVKADKARTPGRMEFRRPSRRSATAS